MVKSRASGSKFPEFWVPAATFISNESKLLTSSWIHLFISKIRKIIVPTCSRQSVMATLNSLPLSLTAGIWFPSPWIWGSFSNSPRQVHCGRGDALRFLRLDHKNPCDYCLGLWECLLSRCSLLESSSQAVKRSGHTQRPPLGVRAQSLSWAHYQQPTSTEPSWTFQPNQHPRWLQMSPCLAANATWSRRINQTAT